MRHDFLDRYSRLSSPVHHLPAALKLGVALAIMASTVALSTSHLWFFAVIAGILVVVLLLARLPIGFVTRRLLLFEPFVLGIAILSLFQAGGTVVFLTVVVKSTICLLTVIVLSNTTRFGDLLGVLRLLHVPPLLVTVLALMYRYIFVLIDEAERMARARRSRTFIRRRTWSQIATVVGQLFVRSTERAERIFAAMTARGWQ